MNQKWDCIQFGAIPDNESITDNVLGSEDGMQVLLRGGTIWEKIYLCTIIIHT